MFINGIPVETYGGIMIGTPRVSNAEYTSEYTHQRTRSTIRHLVHDVGIKEIECHLAFLGDSVYEIQVKRSIFRSALIGALDISFKRDRFSYFVEFDGERELESEHENAAVSIFKFKGVQHLPLKTLLGKHVYCESTVPKTDCKITAIASNNTSNAKVGTVTFPNVLSGDILVVDGIDGIITKNGDPVTVSFIRLPYLTCGDNTIECPFDNITVEYYPTFM